MSLPVVYLDECVHPALADRLRSRGFEVTTAREQGTLGLSDEAQVEFASNNDWVILSYNVRHFVALHQRYELTDRQHAGIVVVPQRDLDLTELRTSLLLDWVRARLPPKGSLFRWHDLQQLLISGLRFPGYGESDIARSLGR